jgi:putative restriction endonuclease
MENMTGRAPDGEEEAEQQFP